MNTRSRHVELMQSEATEVGGLQKGEDYVKAFILGFAPEVTLRC
jgi:rRNA processing protein Krr1/Pno1